MRVWLIILLMFCTAPAFSYGSLDDNSQVENRRSIIHLVKKGETVSSILKSYNLSLAKFLKFNKSLSGTNLSLSLGQQVVINKKDIGSATDAEIATQVRVYLESIGASSATKKEHTETQEQGSTQTELIKNLSTADRYTDDRTSGRATYSSGDPMRVTLLLPLTKRDGTADTEFEAFYKGALLAMSQLKNDGLSMYVDVFDTGHSSDVINNVIADGSLRRSNLVIGPVYKDQFSVVERYLKNRGTVLVSPLAYVETTSSNAFQMAPALESRNDKLKDFFVGKNVVYISSASDDATFLAEIEGYVNKAVSIIRITSAEGDEKLKELLTTIHPAVVIVGAKKHSDIESIVSRVANVKRSLPASHRLEVVGSSEFSKIEDAKRTDLFKSNTFFVSSYHQDRKDELSLEFETQYIEMFGQRPDIFSYRAYDAVMLFASGLNEFGDEFYRYFNDQLMRVLQVGYRFERDGGGNINHEWMLVNYRPDYTIVVK